MEKYGITPLITDPFAGRRPRANEFIDEAEEEEGYDIDLEDVYG